MTFSSIAQFTHYGARVGLGASYFADDLITKSPILGANLGGYVNLGFEDAQSFWADNFYLQFAANFTRRGSNIQHVLEHEMSIRTSYYHDWYFQLLPMACWRYELPVKIPNTFVNFYVGPEVSIGMFGIRWDRCVSPGYPQESMNYDTHITGSKYDRRAFRYARRFDVGINLGIGYQYNNITIDLFWDHGFMPILQESDVLANLAIEQNGGSNDRRIINEDGTVSHVHLDNRNGFTGTNQAFILSIGYQLPLE